jgi:hypothetical protein
MLERSFRTDLRPAAAQQLVTNASHPTQNLVVGYLHEVLTTPPRELDAMVEDAMRRIDAARVKYLLIAGHEPAPEALERITGNAPTRESKSGPTAATSLASPTGSRSPSGWPPPADGPRNLTTDHRRSTHPARTRAVKRAGMRPGRTAGRAGARRTRSAASR